MIQSITPWGRRCWAPAVLAIGVVCLQFWSLAQAESPLQSDFSGVWLVQNPVFAAKTLDGAVPPLRPDALKVYKQHIASREAGDTSYDGATWCSSPGIPRLMFINHPFQISVRPNQVLFLFEWNHWATLVDLSGMNLDVILPSSMGVQSGHWEGDTLVIQIKGLRDNTLLDSAGLPHSEDAKITERLHLKGRNVLENLMRIEDPEDYSRPWETRVLYGRQPGAEIREDVCLDRIRHGKPAINGE